MNNPNDAKFSSQQTEEKLATSEDKVSNHGDHEEGERLAYRRRGIYLLPNLFITRNLQALNF